MAELETGKPQTKTKRTGTTSQPPPEPTAGAGGELEKGTAARAKSDAKLSAFEALAKFATESSKTFSSFKGFTVPWACLTTAHVKELCTSTESAFLLCLALQPLFTAVAPNQRYFWGGGDAVAHGRAVSTEIFRSLGTIMSHADGTFGDQLQTFVSTEAQLYDVVLGFENVLTCPRPLRVLAPNPVFSKSGMKSATACGTWGDSIVGLDALEHWLPVASLSHAVHTADALHKILRFETGVDGVLRLVAELTSAPPTDYKILGHPDMGWVWFGIVAAPQPVSNLAARYGPWVLHANVDDVLPGRSYTLATLGSRQYKQELSHVAAGVPTLPADSDPDDVDDDWANWTPTWNSGGAHTVDRLLKRDEATNRWEVNIPNNLEGSKFHHPEVAVLTRQKTEFVQFTPTFSFTGHNVYDCGQPCVHAKRGRDCTPFTQDEAFAAFLETVLKLASPTFSKKKPPIHAGLQLWSLISDAGGPMTEGKLRDKIRALLDDGLLSEQRAARIESYFLPELK